MESELNDKLLELSRERDNLAAERKKKNDEFELVGFLLTFYLIYLIIGLFDSYDEILQIVF